MGSEIAVARRAGAAGGQSGDGPQGHQPGTDLGPLASDQQQHPESFEFYWQPPLPVYDPAKAKELLAEAGHPNGFDAGEFFCDASYSNVAEALLNNFAEVGIKNRLRPLAPRSSRRMPRKA